jgi:hypothetical protein
VSSAVVLVVVAALGALPGRMGGRREQPATRPRRIRRGDTWWTRLRSAFVLLTLALMIGMAMAAVIGLLVFLGGRALDRALG